MKSTVSIVALAIVILAVIANHGCESATAAVQHKMAAEDRGNTEFCTTFKQRCNSINGALIKRLCLRIQNILCRNQSGWRWDLHRMIWTPNWNWNTLIFCFPENFFQLLKINLLNYKLICHSSKQNKYMCPSTFSPPNFLALSETFIGAIMSCTRATAR